MDSFQISLIRLLHQMVVPGYDLQRHEKPTLLFPSLYHILTKQHRDLHIIRLKLFECSMLNLFYSLHVLR